MYQAFIDLFGSIENYDPDLVFTIASCFGIMVLYTFLRIITSVIFSVFKIK